MQYLLRFQVLISNLAAEIQIGREWILGGFTYFWSIILLRYIAWTFWGDKRKTRIFILED